MNSLWLWLPLALLLGIVIWSIRRHRDPDLRVECDLPIDQLVHSLAGLSLSTPVPGNRVEVLENGAFFDVLIARIAQARCSVHFETFLWKEGELSRRLSQAFAERARAGCQVRILLDATGSRRISDETVARMRDAGCRVVLFNKVTKLRNLGVLGDRDHRKICVIDGREAFVGGHCITDEWLGDAEDKQHFSDVTLRLVGPIVHSVQGAFSENWAGETGELFVGPDVFPELRPQGDILIHAAFVKPERSAPAVKILHHTALCLARERIWIQNPYFIPEPEAIDAMLQAVQRGVDVRVLMPATSGSDNPMVQHAGHRNFEKMLRGGVRLFEYPHTLLHQKVMTIDRIWTAAGSSNFDDRSFETNDEITLAVLDRGLAERMDAIFERYVRRAVEVQLERWQARGPWHKLKDQAVYTLNELM
jgi:cardiolipin synthase A/B